MSLAARVRLGGYEVEALIGAGGMGEVYRARDIKLGRFVAVKILPEAFAADADRVSRFQREAQLLASLNHPHIAALHGMEETPAGHVLVMELVEGETLADRLQRGALPVEDALNIARQIAEALEAAHEKGIVHRDLKPANVKITPDDQSGTAQSRLALFDAKGGTETLKLPLGSYMTPRISPGGRYVAFGNDDGKEVSVWIYELSGASSMRRLTFGGNNQRPIWSPDGQRVAFDSDREGDRAIFWQKADGTDAAERLTRAEQGILHAPKSWSPDGKQFLFEVESGSSNSLWTFSLQDRKSTPIAGVQSTGLLNPVFSPDGRWIAYQSTQAGAPQVYVQPFPSTGAKYQITKTGGYKPVWSPDGKQLFYIPSSSGIPGSTGFGARQFTVVTITAMQPSFTFGNPEPLQRGWVEPSGPPRMYDILPDGKRFIAAIADAPGGETPSGAPAAPQINVVLNWLEELKQRVPVK